MQTLPAVDAVSFLSIWLLLLFGISARNVVGPIGSLGTPALIAGGIPIIWWTASRLTPRVPMDLGRQPLRLPIGLHALVMLASYAVAMSRPVTEIERSGATRAAILILIYSGIALLAADGVRSWTRLRTLISRIALVSSGFAALAVAQFVTGRTLLPPIPGLALHSPEFLGMRGFVRPSSTALHPIEFSVMSAVVFPIALHVAMFAPKGPRRQWAIFGTVLIGMGVPLSISRSGILAFFVALIILLAGWTWRQRANAALLGLAALPLLWLVIPGLVGTLRNMFTNTQDDLSIQVRIDRIPLVLDLFRERPWIGIGRGTFGREDYFLLDNQVYVTLIETGVIGLGITIFLLGAGSYFGLAVKYRPYATREQIHMGRVLASSIAAAGVSTVTFDAFHYRIFMGVLFLLLGLAGALWRISGVPPPELAYPKSSWAD